MTHSSIVEERIVERHTCFDFDKVILDEMSDSRQNMWQRNANNS